MASSCGSPIEPTIQPPSRYDSERLTMRCAPLFERACGRAASHRPDPNDPDGRSSQVLLFSLAAAAIETPERARWCDLPRRSKPHGDAGKHQKPQQPGLTVIRSSSFSVRITPKLSCERWPKRVAAQLPRFNSERSTASAPVRQKVVIFLRAFATPSAGAIEGRRRVG